MLYIFIFFFFSSRRRHTRWPRDWSSDVCSSDLPKLIDASVWMKSWYDGVPPQMFKSVRPCALMMPTVTEPRSRSEERRVGKECRSRGAPYQEKKKDEGVEA